ncbi:MAG: DNA primase noncatalytic subunit PriX [Candidatus Nitrosopolaris sp.]
MISIKNDRVKGNFSFSSVPSSYQLKEIYPLSDGLDFILSHFQEPIFPRTISTSKTQNRQIEVFSKENAFNIFQYSGFVDCKINAYPSFTDYKGINRQPPSFVFIDLDKSRFKSERAHRLALNKALTNINEKLAGAKPTVLWSGNGYHIYQPIDAFILEEYDIFSDFDQPSKAFLKFAEQYLSNDKSDSSHNPSFKSCMIRIPGSHNSKCILTNNGTSDTSTEIKIIQKWDSYRPKINVLLGSFHVYLVDLKLKEIREQKKLNKSRRICSFVDSNNDGSVNTVNWIEKLLQTPIADYRKNAINLILAPYLVNIKKYSYEESFAAIKEWLNKCATIRRFDSNFNSRIKYALEIAMKNGTRPLKAETLKIKNEQLYNILGFKT